MLGFSIKLTYESCVDIEGCLTPILPDLIQTTGPDRFSVDQPSDASEMASDESTYGISFYRDDLLLAFFRLVQTREQFALQAEAIDPDTIGKLQKICREHFNSLKFNSLF